MDGARYKGRKRSFGEWGGMSACRVYVPGVRFPSEKLTDEEVATMGGEVKEYVLSPEELERIRSVKHGH